MDKFEDAVRRCVRAARENGWRPLGVWSTGEKLMVALVLWDRQYLEDEHYGYDEAMTRVAGGLSMDREELPRWLDSVRVRVEEELAA